MIVFFVDHLVVAVFRGVKTAGDPHPSGPVSAPVFPVLAFLHVAGGLALFFALASPPQ